jgi:hypothetical protein
MANQEDTSPKFLSTTDSNDERSPAADKNGVITGDNNAVEHTPDVTSREGSGKSAGGQVFSFDLSGTSGASKMAKMGVVEASVLQTDEAFMDYLLSVASGESREGKHKH